MKIAKPRALATPLRDEMAEAGRANKKNCSSEGATEAPI